METVANREVKKTWRRGENLNEYRGERVNRLVGENELVEETRRQRKYEWEKQEWF